MNKPWAQIGRMPGWAALQMRPRAVHSRHPGIICPFLCAIMSTVFHVTAAEPFPGMPETSLCDAAAPLINRSAVKAIAIPGAAQAQSAAAKAAEQTQVGMSQAAEKGQQVGAAVGQAAVEYGDVAKDKVIEYGGVAKDAAIEYGGVAKDKAVEYGGAAKDAAVQYGGVAKDKAVEYGGAAKDKAVEYGQAAGEYGAAAAGKARELASDAAHKAGEAGQVRARMSTAVLHRPSSLLLPPVVVRVSDAAWTSCTPLVGLNRSGLRRISGGVTFCLRTVQMNTHSTLKSAVCWPLCTYTWQSGCG